MENLTIYETPELQSPRMILGFTGWMDGGRVSTGTVNYLNEKLAAPKFAEIASPEFYILNFPVSTIPVTVLADDTRAFVSSISPMEFSAIFRPHTEIEDGIIRELRFQRNEFRYSKSANLVLFLGEEPHIRWTEYCDCIFAVARQLQVKEVYFVGSVASPIPHTRDPRIRASVANEALKERLRQFDIGFADYQGPGSVVNFLAQRSVDEGMEMSNLVLDVPHYPFLDMPTYPKSMLKAISVLSRLLDLELSLSDLIAAADTTEDRLNEVMGENKEFNELVKTLEEAYDSEEAAGSEELLRRLIDGIDLSGGEGQD